ncbi:MAG: RIP metalloprotease RseP, partial [Ruminococcus sp.]|nr:RIP metalloprotease RseP [Ruminococcus sp.]
MEILTIIALIIIGILLFELIILFHEGGHFLTAKKSGVQVNEFALGMGPKLISFKKGETTYSLRLLPIGGYCAMEGEDEESENPRAFNNAKVWKRMIIIVAGAFMNIVLGFIMMFVIVVQSASFSSTTVDSFPQLSFSANSGLQSGDTIVKMNNYSVWNSQDLSFAIATMKCKDVAGDTLSVYKEDCAITLCNLYAEKYNDKKANYNEKQLKKVLKILTEGTSEINSSSSKSSAKSVMDKYYGKIEKYLEVNNYKIPDIEVKKTRQRYQTDVEVVRDGKNILLKDVQLYTYFESKDAETPSVSVDFYVKPIEKNFATVLQETAGRTISVVRMVWTSLVGLVSGQFSFQDISGPVGAASAITQVASKGLENSFLDAFNSILFMMMLISVNLGVFNMLPFPALDGGRFLFLLIEFIFRKPIPRKAEGIVNGIGLLLLFAFMAVITVKDI